MIARRDSTYRGKAFDYFTRIDAGYLPGVYEFVAWNLAVAPICHVCRVAQIYSESLVRRGKSPVEQSTVIDLFLYFLSMCNWCEFTLFKYNCIFVECFLNYCCYSIVQILDTRNSTLPLKEILQMPFALVQHTLNCIFRCVIFVC